jgi:hypothetical protein
MPEVGTGTPSDVRCCWRWNDRTTPLCKPKTNPSSIRSISATCNRESSTAFDCVSKRLLNHRRCGKSDANSATKESVVPMNSTVLIPWQPGSFDASDRAASRSYRRASPVKAARRRGFLGGRKKRERSTNIVREEVANGIGWMLTYRFDSRTLTVPIDKIQRSPESRTDAKFVGARGEPTCCVHKTTNSSPRTNHRCQAVANVRRIASP